jgi:hypothetical protein
MRTSLAIVAPLVLAGTAVLAETVMKEDAGLRYRVPTTWMRVPAPSDMRAAQYRVPGEGGADAELVLFFFGQGQGGGAEANLERWYAQFTQPDGRASRDAAVVTTRTVGTLKLTTLDLAGTYSPTPMRAGSAAASREGARMLAAVVEGTGGPWFFRLVGPAATVAAAKSDFDALLGSLAPHA